MVGSDRWHQLRWVVHCLDDIASDMSVFHRVDDITALDGPTLMRLAWRLPAYEGAMRSRVMAEQEENPSPSPQGRVSAPRGESREWNPGTQATLQADPALKGIFSFN
ncbi:hypothetical protein [Streptacidiphilus carbonis]|uniref:hypothetical protein n=1 Tax=Streptacidiphilus carbonis TaxID=105422 RepID=UPI0005A76B31|nr:hypothetical protein [Streptacidiphilus carbonis]